MRNYLISRPRLTAVNALRSRSCKPCWAKNPRGESMNRVHDFAFRLLIAVVVLCSCFAAQTPAQTPTPSPSPQTAKPDTKSADEEEPENPFAPEPAGPLPPGMTGSDAKDPRSHLTPGIYNAGETAMGLKHILLLKKPDAFQLGSDNPDDPKVQKTLGAIGVGDAAKLPKPS